MHINFINEDIFNTDLEPKSFDALLCDPPYGLSFMGNEWDKETPNKDIWEKIYNAMKPGAFGLVCSGTKCFWQMGYNLDCAGFEIIDTLLWLHSQGFPKGRNVSKDLRKKGYSDLANLTEGYNTQLKPAYEPIFLVRKPTNNTYADNIIENKCGVLNIDGTRIETNDSLATKRNGKIYGGPSLQDSKTHGKGQIYNENVSGRYPANVLLDGNSSNYLDEQFGESKGRRPKKENNKYFSNENEGGVSRFFYTVKVSKREREYGGLKIKHPTMKPINLTKYLAKLLYLPFDDPKILVPFAGVGSEVIGAYYAGWRNICAIEMDRQYFEWMKERVRIYQTDKPDWIK